MNATGEVKSRIAFHLVAHSAELGGEDGVGVIDISNVAFRVNLF